jgi:hypothetical protein
MADQQKTAAEDRMPVVDDPTAPLVYVEGCIGGGGSGPNMMLTFGARAVDHSGPTPRAYLLTNLRMMIPMESAKGLADFINAMIAEAQPQPPADVPAGSSIQ